MKNKTTAKKAASTKPELKGRNKSAKLAQSGLNTRVRGHLKSANQRSQAKRDSR